MCSPDERVCVFCDASRAAAHRTNEHEFGTVDELQNIDGFGAKTVDNIRPLVRCRVPLRPKPPVK